MFEPISIFYLFVCSFSFVQVLSEDSRRHASKHSSPFSSLFKDRRESYVLSKGPGERKTILHIFSHQFIITCEVPGSNLLYQLLFNLHDDSLQWTVIPYVSKGSPSPLLRASHPASGKLSYCTAASIAAATLPAWLLLLESASMCPCREPAL